MTHLPCYLIHHHAPWIQGGELKGQYLWVAHFFHGHGVIDFAVAGEVYKHKFAQSLQCMNDMWGPFEDLEHLKNWAMEVCYELNFSHILMMSSHQYNRHLRYLEHSVDMPEYFEKYAEKWENPEILSNTGKFLGRFLSS